MQIVWRFLLIPLLAVVLTLVSYPVIVSGIGCLVDGCYGETIWLGLLVYGFFRWVSFCVIACLTGYFVVLVRTENPLFALLVGWAVGTLVPAFVTILIAIPARG